MICSQAGGPTPEGPRLPLSTQTIHGFLGKEVWLGHKINMCETPPTHAMLLLKVYRRRFTDLAPRPPFFGFLVFFLADFRRFTTRRLRFFWAFRRLVRLALFAAFLLFFDFLDFFDFFDFLAFLDFFDFFADFRRRPAFLLAFFRRRRRDFLDRFRPLPVSL